LTHENEIIELLKDIRWVLERMWRLDDPPQIDEDDDPVLINVQRKEWEKRHDNAV
jgi:hypothetical protein